MMTEDEFEGIRRECSRAQNPNGYQDRLRSLLDYGPEKQRFILELALAKLGQPYVETYTWEVCLMAGELFKAGVTVPDGLISGMVEAMAVGKYQFSCFPMVGFIEWVERQEAGDGLSIPLLTCLRKHFPLMSRPYADKRQRALMRRFAVLLKLQSGDVMPEVRDAWTAGALKWRESLPPDSAARWDALLLLANRQHSNKPGKGYLKEAAGIVAGLPQFTSIMRDILDSIGRDGPLGVRYRGYPSPRKDLLDDDFTDLLRALIYLCVPYSDLIGNLRDAGQRCCVKIKNIGPISAKISAACAQVLSQQQDDAATQAISTLQKSAKHKTTRRGIDKAVVSVEERSGTEWAQLEERSVPDFGFSIANNPALKIEGYSVTLGFSRSGHPILVWKDSSGAVGFKTPTCVQLDPSSEATELKSLSRELKKTWRNQVTRLEGMMCQGRRISGAEWRRHYLEHAIVGPLSRRLLWQVGGTLFGFGTNDDAHELDCMVTIDGAPFVLGDHDMVNLWHPADLLQADRAAWERWVVDGRLDQPFQQALREVFLPDNTDLSCDEDLRFAGEKLHQGALAAVCREREWKYSFHGDSSQFNPWRDFPQSGIRAVLRLTAEGMSVAAMRIVSVRFFAESNTKQVPLNSVPPVVFSEAMRDVGLLIYASRVAVEKGWRNSIPADEKS